ncbi:MAG: hypothetical protein AAF850_05205 [Pseudomonadota bacterium]
MLLIKGIKRAALAALALCVAAPQGASASKFEKIAGLLPQKEFTPPRPPVRLSTCAGVRGNGQNLFAHFGVLARQVEEYGPVTCAAGGSSGSLTVFILESIWANPDVHLCSRFLPCRPAVRNARIALMLKSFTGIAESGLFADAAAVAALLDGLQQEQIMEQMAGPSPAEGVAALIRLLRDLGPLINPEFIQLLLTSPDPVFHAMDVIEGLQDGVNFVVNNPRVFLRTSVVDFNQFAELIGVYGSFYASDGPANSKGVARWLRACAMPSRGKTWAELSTLPGVGNRTCGETFGALFDQYRRREARFGGATRIDDPVGKFLPVFGVTGVITGASVQTWQDARDAWIAATPIPFEPDFSDIGVGYWGDADELKTIEENLPRLFSDLGSMRFVPLGQAKWREVLASSPAEPGFAPGIPLPVGAISVGGWADPLRVLPLRALGPRATIAVNRQDGVGSFTKDVTRLLNASDAELNALYSVTDPRSTFSLGLGNASGVWCTNWDGQMGDPNRLFNDAYTSPLITDFFRFLFPRFGYPNVGPDFVIDGCNPATHASM